ncbi:MAG: cytochrome b/b6 domain-containing protein [Bacteroidota bacterium]
MNMRKLSLSFLSAGLIVLALGTGLSLAYAKRAASPAVKASPVHPTFALLDQDGQQVLQSGKDVSTMKTCGECHDTDFIQSHAFHSDLGLSAYDPSGETWDAGSGFFGKWDPLTYRYLSQKGDQRLDLSTAGWLILNADRVVGGGPAMTSREGTPLAGLKPDAADPEASVLDSKTGAAGGWDWSVSGTMEMNCFLCHLESPNNTARLQAIRAGQFGQANTATLLGTGIVVRTTQGYFWNKNAFDENGSLKERYVLIQDPTNENCAACHGEIHADTASPLTLSACDLSQSQTATTGQVIAPQKINESGMNVAGKDALARSWDIHAERQLKCTDCHFALNNPAHALDTRADDPAHLVYDPRKLDIGEYIQRPDHTLARGQSAQFNIQPDMKATMRRCDSCHDARKAHADWLPYVDKHMAAVACESCHIPRMYAPAIQSYDWTVVTTDGQAVKTCRGVQGDPASINSLVTGFAPALLNRSNVDGDQLLAPYNLITSYFWVYDDPNGTRPVRQVDLESAYLKDGAYAADIVSAFDANGDGSLSSNELVIDTTEKEQVVASRLAGLGLQKPRIQGMVQPYSINHDVARGESAVNDCQTCHTSAGESRLTRPMKLAAYAPAGILPEFVADTNVQASGRIAIGQDGAVYYTPAPARDRLYVFGSSRIGWIDGLGALAFAGALLGVLGHGTLRYFTWRRQPRSNTPTERVYMYEPYRRFWHWLQTLTIVTLLFTGLIIHRPDIFGIFSFRGVVVLHNVLAAILVINALLAVFYHLTTGRIHEYVPRPYGFFDDAIVQAKYYARGIFKGESHPFEKKPDSRMNPIQKATYFAILMVLLPLQIVTGALMWGVQRWPAVADWLGGLPVLAPFHSLVAWLFAAFIIVHVYMTSTGATPLEATRAMVTGWEEVEVHEPEEKA